MGGLYDRRLEYRAAVATEQTSGAGYLPPTLNPFEPGFFSTT